MGWLIRSSTMVLGVILMMMASGTAVRGVLQVGFYSQTCPNAESIVSSAVSKATQSDPTMPAALLRLHYHDCIVQGCDGSVLIQKPRDDGPENSSPNHAGLRGFDVVDNAKTQLEAECPGIVSCADIVALAARDSIVLSKGPFYQVPTGRRDGRVSKIKDAENMPDLPDSIELIKEKFAEKGLSPKDIVLLNGAHTIGTTACFFLERRLYDFLPGGRPDPLINRNFLPELRSECPEGGDINVRVGLDRGSERKFDTRIFENIRAGFGVIESDAKMYTNPFMREVIDSYTRSSNFKSKTRSNFGSDFVESIIRLGTVGVHTGQDGEISKKCWEFN